MFGGETEWSSLYYGGEGILVCVGKCVYMYVCT